MNLDTEISTIEVAASVAPVVSDVAVRRGGFPFDKPMEDFALSDDHAGVYVVCDGVTRTASAGNYPNPSPASLAAKQFAETFHEEVQSLSRQIALEERLSRALVIANLSVRSLNSQLAIGTDYLENDLAGTVAAVALRSGAFIHYAYLGDCAIYHAREGAVTLLTPPQTAAVAALRNAHGRSNEVTVTIRRDYRNNLRNKSSFGCFTGQSEAIEFVRGGSIAMQERDIVFMASDGLNAMFTRPEIVIGANSARDIVNLAVAQEVESGVEGDDKALIRIVIGA
jgi:serine/threonine protein phosphatase PrpC